MHFDDGESLPFTENGTFAILENNLYAELTYLNLTVTSTKKYSQNEDDFNREYTTVKQIQVYDAKFHELDKPVFSCLYWEDSTMFDCKNKVTYDPENSGILTVYLDKPIRYKASLKIEVTFEENS